MDESTPEFGAVRRVQSGDVIWKSDVGFIKGRPGGRVERMNYNNISMDTSETGETAMGKLNINGVEAIIGVPQRPKPGKLRSKDWSPDFINETCG